MFTGHDSEYEYEAAKCYRYPHGFGVNLTWFSDSACLENVADTAVNNLKDSESLFKTEIQKLK